MMSKHKLILHQYFDKIKLAYLESQQIFKTFVLVLHYSFNFLLQRLKSSTDVRLLLVLGKESLLNLENMLLSTNDYLLRLR